MPTRARSSRICAASARGEGRYGPGRVHGQQRGVEAAGEPGLRQETAGRGKVEGEVLGARAVAPERGRERIARGQRRGRPGTGRPAPGGRWRGRWPGARAGRRGAALVVEREERDVEAGLANAARCRARRGGRRAAGIPPPRRRPPRPRAARVDSASSLRKRRKTTPPRRGAPPSTSSSVSAPRARGARRRGGTVPSPRAGPWRPWPAPAGSAARKRAARAWPAARRWAGRG